MIRILLLSLLCSLQALAQDQWVNYPVDENCEVMFPHEPMNAGNEMQEQRYADINGVRVFYQKMVYNANVPVANKDDLQSLYRETFKGTLNAVDGTMEDFNYEYRDDIMLARVVYTMRKPGVNSCEARIMLAKGKYYVFQACTMPENKEAMKEVTEKFFRNVTINANLTEEDQKLPYEEERSVPFIIGGVIAVLIMILFLLWIILYVVLVATRSSDTGGILYKLFGALRWSGVALFFLAAVIALMVSILSQIESNEFPTVSGIATVILGAIGTIMLIIKPPSTNKPSI